MSFFEDLRRRNVFRIGIAYLAAVWVLIQVADTILPVINADPWILQAMVFSAALGFPLALVLAWSYKLTAEGIKATADVETLDAAKFTGRKVDFAIIGLLVVAVGFLLVRSPPEDQVSVLPNSVAVLPFSNLSPDPDNAYFATGLHDEILNQLANLAELSVISRTSVLRYEDSELSIPEIAAELNVGTVMEGSVRYANDRVRITTQLIDAQTDEHLWSETYDREFADIFAIESDIAMNIANALEAEFSSAEQQTIEKVPTVSPEAYALYLRSLSITRSSDLSDLDRAIELDPNFALAYARRAWWRSTDISMSADVDTTEAERVALDSAEKALALDPALGLAHLAIANVHEVHWRWAEARRSYELAYRLSPNNAFVASAYTRYKRNSGDYASAIRVGLRAVALDPVSHEVGNQLGVTYRSARDHESAAELYRRLIDLRPPALAAMHGQLGLAEASLGNFDAAVENLRIAEELYGENIPQVFRYAHYAMGYALAGQRDDAERMAAALEERAQRSPVGDAVWATIDVALGNYDQAFARVEAAMEAPASANYTSLIELKANPWAFPQLEEPRFKDVLCGLWLQ